MKKLKLGILTFMTAVLLASGCAKGGTAPAEAELPEASIPETGVGQEASPETEVAAEEEYLVGPAYDAYLDWTAEKWLSASQEEQARAVTAYTVYWGKMAGREELSLEVVEGQKETVQDMLETLRSALSRIDPADVTLKEIAEAGGSLAGDGGFTIENAGLGEYGKYLSYTSEDWAAAGEEEREEVTLAYALLSCAFAGNSVDAGTLRDSGVDLASYTDILDRVFEELAGTGYTLEDAVENLK